MERLTKAEEEVMQVIWTLERCTVSQIVDFIEQELQLPRPAQTTISTIVRIMEQKGYLDHKAYGRTYEYFPLISKADYSRRTLKKFVQDYFDGSMQGLVSFLVKSEKMTESELDELKKLLEDQK